MTGHPARRGSPWRAVAVANAVALGAVGGLAAPRLGVPTALAVTVAAAAGVLVVLALPSLSTRRATVLVLGIGALGALRHAALPTADGELLVLWAGATLVSLVLIDRADAETAPRLAGTPALAARVPEAARVAVAIGAVVALLAVAVVPTVTRELGRQSWLGELPTFDDAANAPASLRASRDLDMTRRPRLSDRVVFTVDAERPDFWRGEIFDVWDGQTWTRSRSELFTLSNDDGTARMIVDPLDVGTRTGEATTQTFRIETRFSEIIFAAPSPVEVRSEKTILGRPDGTAAVIGGLGRGAVYTVTSRRVLATADDLRAADSVQVPGEILARYAQAPPATERVRRLSASIAATATTTYDKVRAFEEWLGANTRYSLDAPLSPAGVDVVDHFLFESRLGWCEQVASSLVVLARSAGIPARLATGFVPGESNGLAGRFVVRERDAHAWAEVYFPGVGWQGFDPTASVPLAGEAGRAGSWLERARSNAAEFALVVGAIVLAAAIAPGAAAAARRHLRRRRSWPARALARLERVGARSGRPRHPAEGPREYARILAGGMGDPRVVDVGAAIDRDLFGPSGTSEAARDRADALLAELSRHPNGK